MGGQVSPEVQELGQNLMARPGGQLQQDGRNLSRGREAFQQPRDPLVLVWNLNLSSPGNYPENTWNG